MARFDKGWVKIYRSVSSNDPSRNEFFGDVYLYAIWHLLIQWANVSDSKTKLNGNLVHLKRGQLVTSRKEICKQLGIGEQTVRRCLVYLEKSGKINQRTNQRGTVVTICNYSEYQDSDELPNQRTNQRPTNDQPHSEEEKKKRRIKTPPPTPPEQQKEGEGVKTDFSEPAMSEQTELLDYAEKALDRKFNSSERFAFLAKWHQNPHIRPADLKKEIDFVSSHPQARADTKSINRVFFGLRAHYRAFDVKVINAIAELRQQGLRDAEIAAILVKSNKSLDPGLLTNFVLNLCDNSPPG